MYHPCKSTEGDRTGTESHSSCICFNREGNWKFTHVHLQTHLSKHDGVTTTSAALWRSGDNYFCCVVKKWWQLRLLRCEEVVYKYVFCVVKTMMDCTHGKIYLKKKQRCVCYNGRDYKEIYKQRTHKHACYAYNSATCMNCATERRQRIWLRRRSYWTMRLGLKRNVSTSADLRCAHMQ